MQINEALISGSSVETVKNCEKAGVCRKANGRLRDNTDAIKMVEAFYGELYTLNIPP